MLQQLRKLETGVAIGFAVLAVTGYGVRSHFGSIDMLEWPRSF